MRLAFLGTPDFSVVALDALIAAGHEIACVYSQPPRRAGRGKSLRPSPVHQFAGEKGIEVRTPVSVKSEPEQAAFAALDLDAAVVVAYGLILPAGLLSAPRHGCFNIHASLLPRWRGAAPIQRAILAGDGMSGVTIMQMDEGLDTGPMLLREEIALTPEMTAGDLHDRLAEIGGRLITETLAAAEAGLLDPVVQPLEGVTYAAKISKGEAALDWRQPAVDVERAIRAFNPVPGAFFMRGGERIRLLAADVVSGKGHPGTILDDAMTIACGEAAIRPTLVQRQGKRAMTPAELLNGYDLPQGEILALPDAG
ncbi:MAG: methionyl-tRNA formyltransferase [Rhodospirillales bacterium]